MSEFEEYEDFANQIAVELQQFTFSITLSPKLLQKVDFELESLNWKSINFRRAELDKLPDDKRGIYALVISNNGPVLPQHGCVMYVGIAGKSSDRPLRERCKDYFSARKNIKDRPHVAKLIGSWHEVLKLFYAPVESDFSTEKLLKLEKQINDCLLPYYSRGDLSAEVKHKRKAF